MKLVKSGKALTIFEAELPKGYLPANAQVIHTIPVCIDPSVIKDETGTIELTKILLDILRFNWHLHQVGATPIWRNDQNKILVELYFSDEEQKELFFSLYHGNPSAK